MLLATLFPGPSAPTAAQQLCVCINQTQQLVTSMKNTINTVDNLAIHVFLWEGISSAESKAENPEANAQSSVPQGESRSGDDGQEAYMSEHSSCSRLHLGLSHADSSDIDSDTDTQGYQQPVCPATFRIVTGGVYALLAEAVPCLQTLRLQGCCWDAALDVFGASCSQLRAIVIQPLSVQMEALRGLGASLPHLTTLRFQITRIYEQNEEQLGKYMDAAMLEVKLCKALTHLVLHFDASMTLTCQPDSWVGLPCTLKCLECNCRVESSDTYATLMHTLTSLSLLESPCQKLVELFSSFPHLCALTLTGYDGLCVDFSGELESELRLGLLRKRFLEEGLFSRPAS